MKVSEEDLRALEFLSYKRPSNMPIWTPASSSVSKNQADDDYHEGMRKDLAYPFRHHRSRSKCHLWWPESKNLSGTILQSSRVGGEVDSKKSWGAWPPFLPPQDLLVSKLLATTSSEPRHECGCFAPMWCLLPTAVWILLHTEFQQDLKISSSRDCWLCNKPVRPFCPTYPRYHASERCWSFA